MEIYTYISKTNKSLDQIMIDLLWSAIFREQNKHKSHRLIDFKKDKIIFTEGYSVEALEDYYYFPFHKYDAKEYLDGKVFFNYLFPYLIALQEYGVLSYVESGGSRFQLNLQEDGKTIITFEDILYTNKTIIYLKDYDIRMQLSKVLYKAYQEELLYTHQYKLYQMILHLQPCDEMIECNYIFNHKQMEMIIDKKQKINKIIKQLENDHQELIKKYADRNFEIANGYAKIADEQISYTYDHYHDIDYNKDFELYFYYALYCRDELTYYHQYAFYDHPYIKQMIQEELKDQTFIKLKYAIQLDYDKLEKMYDIEENLETYYDNLLEDHKMQIKNLKDDLMCIYQAFVKLCTLYEEDHLYLSLHSLHGSLPSSFRIMLTALNYQNIDQVLDDHEKQLFLAKVNKYKQETKLTLLQEILIDLGIDFFIHQQVAIMRITPLSSKEYDFMIEKHFTISDEIYDYIETHDDSKLNHLPLNQWLKTELILCDKLKGSKYFFDGKMIKLSKKYLNQDILKIISPSIKLKDINKVYLFYFQKNDDFIPCLFLVGKEYYLLQIKDGTLKKIRRSSDYLKKAWNLKTKAIDVKKTMYDRVLLISFCEKYHIPLNNKDETFYEQMNQDITCLKYSEETMKRLKQRNIQTVKDLILCLHNYSIYSWSHLLKMPEVVILKQIDYL